MNNFLNILAISEKDMHRVVFVKDREEGGINSVYDPHLEKEIFQVFIHNRLPYRSVSEWSFDTFAEARRFASDHFAKEWEFLSWDMKTHRPCEDGGRECGSGECDTCKSIKSEGGTPKGCAGEEAVGSCGMG